MFEARPFISGLSAIGLVGALVFSMPLNAGQMDVWSGWTQLDADDGIGPNGYVDPGWGGQMFDAEYLFYKLDGDMLSIGVQTGFDLSDGMQYYGSHAYYAGDLALSFNGGGYDFAVDFGLVTRDIDYTNVGNGSGNQDAAGFYAVSTWNNDISFSSSSPFAMDEGFFISGLAASTSGSAWLPDGRSYYRTATIDLSSLGLEELNEFGAHWTMSCGNDFVEGRTRIADVPEPGILFLLAGGIVGLFSIRRSKTAA